MELEKEWAGPREEMGLELATLMPAQEDLHMSILQSILELKAGASARPQSGAGQERRRDLEKVVRLRAVQTSDRLVDLGYSPGEAARRLGVNERTLRHWAGKVGLPPGGGPFLGRPPARASAAQVQEVAAWLDTMGPGVGVPSLRRHFGEVARAELDHLLKAYRRDWRAEHVRLLHVLRWQRPGTVWAMDFAEAPCVIDGLHGYLLAVRDLASGNQLLWQPVVAPTAEVVLAELEILFAVHGAPWVLKTDNGSAFIAEGLRQYLARCGVMQLYSPARKPMYNGSIEASIGALKTRTERQSEGAGRPGVWTGADVESARQEANATARPRRLHGMVPRQVWEGRGPLTLAERASFQATVEQYRREERNERGVQAQEQLTRR